MGSYFSEVVRGVTSGRNIVLLIHIMVYGKHISCENPNKYKSMKTYTQQLLSNVSRTIKYRFLIIKIGVIFFCL